MYNSNLYIIYIIKTILFPENLNLIMKTSKGNHLDFILYSLIDRRFGKLFFP